MLFSGWYLVMEAGAGWGVHCSGINGSWMQCHWREEVKSTVLSKAFIERLHCSITQCLTQLAALFTWASPLLWQWVCILIISVAVRAGPSAGCVTIGHVWHASTEEKRAEVDSEGLFTLGLFSLWQKAFSLFCSIDLTIVLWNTYSKHTQNFGWHWCRTLESSVKTCVVVLNVQTSKCSVLESTLCIARCPIS